MGTALGSKTAATPSLKLRNVGDYVDFHIVDLDENLPRYEFGTGNLRIGRNGKPQTQHRLIVVVAGGNGVISDDTANPVVINGKQMPGDRPAQPGEVAAIYIAGRDKWDPDLDKGRTGNVGRSWGAAVDQLDGGLQCGDKGRWTFEAEVPGQGAQPRKVRTFLLRHPKADEAEVAERCEQLLADRRQQPHTAVGSGNGHSDDEYEEPF